MIKDIWKSVDAMEINTLKQMVQELRMRSSSISLEERIMLYFGYLKLDYLDNAMLQVQLLYSEIKEFGLENSFIVNHPDLHSSLVRFFSIWEDACGDIHILDDSDECAGCCCGCAGCLAIVLLVSCGACGVDEGWCCNCNDNSEGGICGFCCGHCIDSSAKCCCGCDTGIY